MAEPIRILIADDHTIVRSGVRLLLEAEPDMVVVGEALNGKQAVELAEQLSPTLILMDISMPELDGLEATRQIKERWPDIQILVLTMHRSDEYFFEVLKAGASGYILKAANTEELVHAVRVTAQGDVFLYPSMAKRLLSGYLSRLDDASDDVSLSPREKEILRLLAEGFTNREIADKLVVSPSTIHSHRNNLMRKLGFSNRRDLIQYARQRGLITGG